MTLARLMVYSQSIEDFKHKRMSRNLKRSCYSNQDHSRFKKRDKTQEEPRSAKVNWRKEVVLKMSSLHVSLVERGIMANVYRVPRVAMVVIRNDRSER